MSAQPYKYTFEESSKVGDVGLSAVINWLQQKEETIEVRSVVADPQWQALDIDLLWTVSMGGGLKVCTVEVKADRYFRTGNYFIETESNSYKGTQGCLLYSQAICLVYLFVPEMEAHIIKLPLFREWFLNNIDRFPEKGTSTKVGSSGYTSKGRLVPRSIVADEVGVQVVNIGGTP